MSVRRKPVLRANGGIADLFSKPQGENDRQGTRHECFEVLLLSAVIDAFPAPFAVADQCGRIILQNIHWRLVNAKCPLRSGITGDDDVFMRTFGVTGCSSNDLPSVAKHLREIFTGKRSSFSLAHKHTCGCAERWFQMDATQIRDLPGHVAIIHRDINDLRQAQCDINRLSIELLEAQDNERSRIARVIHDTTAQDLVASKLYLEKALNGVEQWRSFYASGVKALDHLGHSLCEIRTLSYLLYRPDLGECDFGQIVRSFLNGFVERTGIQVAFDMAVKLPPMSANVKRVLFLIIQEALTNVYRHSGSHAAVVTMRSTNSKLVLEVVDYGRGCPTWLIEGNLSTGAGVGIASMRAQANQYHGALAIQSNESGTTLRVVFPSVYLTRAAEIALS